MAVYAVAFVLYTLDLSRRAAPVPVAASTASGTTGGVTVLERPQPPARRSPRYLNAAVALTVVGWVLHVVSAVLRGVAAERVPWANMFEFSLTATAIIVGVYLAVQFWQDLRFLGAFVIGFVTIALGIATVSFYVDVVPLPPALQSAWLVIHVFVASLATGFLGIGSAVSIVQLLKARRSGSPRALAALPDADALERIAYRLIVIGFVFWTFTLIAGAVWAERAWGRYWGWDTKEVWTFIVWVLFAGYIHARATRGWRGSRSAWLSIVGFSALIFNFTIVNVFFKGLHAYSGL
ncbi:MAG TPA: c-type cytochrome biogenesis protein CcsB [Rhodoglobus sp.]|nr:c-type cytochrome biogenesis protein CcsB [Rhodoglobus sp.]